MQSTFSWPSSSLPKVPASAGPGDQHSRHASCKLRFFDEASFTLTSLDVSDGERNYLQERQMVLDVLARMMEFDSMN